MSVPKRNALLLLLEIAKKAGRNVIEELMASGKTGGCLAIPKMAEFYTHSATLWRGFLSGSLPPVCRNLQSRRPVNL